MVINRIDNIPLGLGDASCDDKLRFKLKSGWPNYFLRDGRTECPLFVATLDHRTIQVFEREEFIRLRSHLIRIKDPNRLIRRYIQWGGEAKLDRHGRFYLPARVREYLEYNPADREFTIQSGLPVTLMLREEHDEEAAALSYGPEIRSQGDAAFADSGAFDEESR